MRMAMGALSDFVPGKYSVPQNPVITMRRNSMGDFVPGRFSLPGYYGKSGLGRIGAGCGCGSKCGCGPCSGGMGAVDFSPSSSGIATALSTNLNIQLPAVPNWVVYAGGLALFYAVYSSSHGSASGRRRY